MSGYGAFTLSGEIVGSDADVGEEGAEAEPPVAATAIAGRRGVLRIEGKSDELEEVAVRPRAGRVEGSMRRDFSHS